MPADIARRNIINADKALLPNITAKGSVQVTLSADLHPLLIADAGSISITSASYAKGKRGYVIEMNDVAYPLVSLINIYSKFGNTTGWHVAYDAYTADGMTFGLVNLENVTVQVQVVVNQTQPNVYSVSVQTLSKGP